MTTKLPSGMSLPGNLNDIDAEYLTTLLRARGVISDTNAVIATEESGVGMTAGYFSSIKRVRCSYQEPTDAPVSFIAKAWPEFEMAPSENIAEMFAKDIQGYLVDEPDFYPRPRVFLADFNSQADEWALIMEDVCVFADQKVHENGMTMDEVMRMIPRLVDVAVTWEGCHQGERSVQLDELNIGHWASDANLSSFRNIMPGGARLFDHVSSMPDSSLVNGLPWDLTIGPGVAELFTNKLDAYYNAIKPEQGGTCTLAHGDLRGDNLFFCDPRREYPHGWVSIDYQMMFRGPVPSDLAYLLNSGSVLPEVYGGANRNQILREFYDQFMLKTQIYPDYSWEQFQHEYAVMATVLFVYYVGFGAAIWQAGLNNEQPGRIELGDRGETEADLSPDELRKRMWWTKSIANFRTTFNDFGFHEHLSSLPDNKSSMGEWVEVPERLRR